MSQQSPGQPDAQLAAALAARAKMERLLASPSPFADDDGGADPRVTQALEDTSQPRHLYLDHLWQALVASRLIVPVAAHPRGGTNPTPTTPRRTPRPWPSTFLTVTWRYPSLPASMR